MKIFWRRLFTINEKNAEIHGSNYSLYFHKLEVSLWKIKKLMGYVKRSMGNEEVMNKEEVNE